MTGPPASDDDLLARLANVVAQADPVPAAVLEAGIAALATHNLDAELAELVADSAEDTAAVVRNSTPDIRLLSFESAGITVELQVSADGAGRAVRGLAAGAVGDVRAETMSAAPGQALTAPLGAGGWFTLAGLLPGPLRLHLQAADGAAVVTSWVSI